MRKHGVFLLPVLMLSLFLFACPAHALTWPASREELAEANLTDRNDYFEDTQGDASEEWAKLWVRKNYGEDAVILSTRRVATETPSGINVERLLGGYEWLSLSTWEITFRVGTLLDDPEQPDDPRTVRTRVVCLKDESRYPYYWTSTLVGFLPPEETFHDLFEVRAYLREDPRFADSLADLRTVVPEGVTEIDLRTVLGDDVLDVEDAFMLSENVCVILRFLPGNDDIGGSGSDYEIILLNMRDRSILSRTPVPNVEYYYRQGWEGGAFYLLFEPEGVRRYDDPAPSCIKVTVARDGTVDIDGSAPSGLTVMPGGKTAVRAAMDGSLYAVDAATGEEELLIQGVPSVELLWDEGYTDEEIAEYFPLFDEDYRDAVAAYVPFWDELPENWEELNDYSYPFESTMSSDIFSIRQFHVEQPLDEHRFVYFVSSWEWYNGYGVYDLRTRTDHRITGRGDLYGVAGGKLFGSTLMADANTYETSPLPESVREQFWEMDPYDGSVNLDFSPDGRLLALTNMESWDSGVSTVTVTDIGTGAIVKAYDLLNPFATVSSVTFYDNGRFMLFFRAEEHGSAFIYLFDIEK